MQIHANEVCILWKLRFSFKGEKRDIDLTSSSLPPNQSTAMSETSVTDTELQPHNPKIGGNDPQRGSQGPEVHAEASTASESDRTLSLPPSTRPPREIHGIKWVFAGKLNILSFLHWR